ncbi:heavy metal-associated isoprenylated plant protein 39-like [Primulina huaijiensis]|uniref:heavy metal-associated isoprenylated plant protein 39-like n=1 Tax=Primulina huaijiensis TaxID=1492673 RepID=UPI003CC77EAD
MKKVVLKLDFVDEKTKQKAMKNISGISGIESIAMDSKEKKLTVTGDIDPVAVVAKLRKLCHTEIVSVGPAKEPEKKKEEPKKEESKKEQAKKEEPKKKDGPNENVAARMYHQHPYYHTQYQPYLHPQAAEPPSYYVRSVEEEPNGCVIC